MMQRISVIEQRLREAFTPSRLEVIDDSHKHIGHAGAEGGAGHYTVIIAAESLKDVSRIDAHRKIYEVLADLIPSEIHALVINVVKS